MTLFEKSEHDEAAAFSVAVKLREMDTSNPSVSRAILDVNDAQHELSALFGDACDSCGYGSLSKDVNQGNQGSGREAPCRARAAVESTERSRRVA